jgi:YHS domain-containing protein
MNAKSKKIGTMLLVTGIFLVGLTMLNGCKKEEPTATEKTMEHQGHEKMAMAEKTVEAVAASLEQKTCPVMGSPINKAIFVEYEGKKVYFCCPPCKDKFSQEPEKYIAKLPQFQQKTQ